MITSKTQGIHANEATYLHKSIHTLSYKTSVRSSVRPIPNIRPNIRPVSADIIRPNIRPRWPIGRISKKRQKSMFFRRFLLRFATVNSQISFINLQCQFFHFI